MCQMLLSINPEYVDKILAQTKKFEYRKTRCRANVDTIIIYSTYPVMRVVGEVKVLEIIEDTTSIVWQKTKANSGITKRFFDSYYKGRDKAVAYRLGKIKRYKKPMLLSEFGLSCAPQSFVYIK
ncbi:MAG: ASCH domain-containing protein [Alphaproteobacteria bacterium]|nr:ASCH domain-containing protein [Alphaproteobacteria bacterium]